MTLILTELTDAGIAMAADSAIAEIRAGKIHYKVKTWKKLFRATSIDAAVSYWGAVGKVVYPAQDFPHWLATRLASTTSYSDLPTLASFLAAEMNTKCGGKPLPDGYDVGLHVAGFHAWKDGHRRPVVFHVHNRHSHVDFQPILFGPKGQPVKSTATITGGAMGLFEVRQNFPNPEDGISVATDKLSRGFLLRNGDYAPFAMFGEQLYALFLGLNQLAGCSIPRHPSKISSRMGLLRAVLSTIVTIHGVSTLPPTIGLPIYSEGIEASGFVNA